MCSGGGGVDRAPHAAAPPPLRAGTDKGSIDVNKLLELAGLGEESDEED